MGKTMQNSRFRGSFKYTPAAARRFSAAIEIPPDMRHAVGNPGAFLDDDQITDVLRATRMSWQIRDYSTTGGAA